MLVYNASRRVRTYTAMLRLSIRQAEKMYGHKLALANRIHPRERVLASNGPRFEVYKDAGIGVSAFLASGFTISDLLDIGMCGSCFATEPASAGVSRFEGLADQWHELASWSMVDLAQSNATMLDMKLLGVTMESLRSRGLPAPGFVALKTVSMNEWKEFGLRKADLVAMRLTTEMFRRKAWAYHEIQACWGFKPSDMTHIGYRLTFGLL